jgi:hypothetical protein
MSWEPYRVITDLEALVEGFWDRIDDLNTTLEQIEMAGGMAKGQLQKALTANPGKHVSRPRDHRRASNKRNFGWESLGKALKGTGLALVLVVDDDRFADTKSQLMQRKRPRQTSDRKSSRPPWLLTPAKSRKLLALRNAKLSPAKRKAIARKAGKASAKARRRKSKPAVCLPISAAAPCAATA